MGGKTVREHIHELRQKSWRELLIGEYDWGFLCMPRLNPWAKKYYYNSPRFFGRNEFVSLLIAITMGLQHAMAMVGGIITPPRLVYSESPSNVNKAQYIVSAALICSGIMSLLQVCRFKLWGGKQIGSGLLSVMGTSFTFLPIAQSAISQMTGEGGHTWDEAYGKVIGTFAICSLTQMFVSMLPPKVLRRAFPPVVCGVTVFLIGAGLASSGFKNWGGGAFCGDNYKGLVPPNKIANCFTNTTSGMQPATCYQAPFVPLCDGNGFVMEKFGHSAYVSMGLSVFLFLVFIEIFGSPFLRNCNILLALFFGCFVSGVSKNEGRSYWDNSIMDAAPAFTFIWTRTFPLGLYGPMVLPALIAFLVTSVETIGDITATEEGSREPTDGPSHDRHVQGAILGDGCYALLACLGTSMPNTTYAQNSGIVALTRCASRAAGICCGIWLLVMGILGKFGAFFVAIPNCVLGGMTTFLFANVSVTGFKVMCMNGMQRRDRFICMCALGFALGVSMVPQWVDNTLWPVRSDMATGERAIRDSIIMILHTPFCFGALVAMILNLLLPQEASDEELTAHEGLPAVSSTAAMDLAPGKGGLYDDSTHHGCEMDKSSQLAVTLHHRGPVAEATITTAPDQAHAV